MKKALFYTFLIQFFLVFIVTILGLIQVVTIKDGYLDKLFYVLILELIASVIAVFRKADFFSDEKVSMQPITAKHESERMPAQLIPLDVLVPVAVNEDSVSDMPAISVASYFETLKKLHDRFLEKEKFIKSVNGLKVEWIGYVNSVSSSINGAYIQLKVIPETGGDIFFAEVPPEHKITAFALRKGDRVVVKGKLDTMSMASSPSIKEAATELVIATNEIDGSSLTVPPLPH